MSDGASLLLLGVASLLPWVGQSTTASNVLPKKLLCPPALFW
jgi:hypothetical protein